MPDIEINGKKITAKPGSNIIEAAKAAGVYIPHFCYHKKLSIAASCRMCLVELEKSPKLMPACATQVYDGMKIFTKSEKTRSAQKSVLEFLLINHPLDCPICDKGGECQLQDIAVGYGSQGSRFKEKKRRVSRKEMGPLICAEEMSRCIHCSRCVRFSQEIAGIQELGMANRAEDSEIMSFFGQIVSSEISGNLIDVCPVGALTSMPFRYSARAWELSRRKTIAPHDGLGSNLIVQVLQHKVKRVLPFQNDALNECWLSDRDRFSYEALNSNERLLSPMIKHGGRWYEVNWKTALDYVVTTLSSIAKEHGKESIGALISPISTNEEMFLFQKLLRKFGVNNIDSRLRRSDFRADKKQEGVYWLGSGIDELLSAQSILLIGSTLRSEQPLLAARIRQAVKNGCDLNVVHSSDDDLLCQINSKLIAAPNELTIVLAQVLKALLLQTGSDNCVIDLAHINVSEEAQIICKSLLDAKHSALVLGEVSQNNPAFADILFLAQEIARLSESSFGLFSSAGNSVGADMFGAVPHKAAFGLQSEPGENASQMFKQPRKGYLLFNTEPEADCYDTHASKKALMQAESVIAFTSFRGKDLLDYSDVLLPIAPFTETAGSFINMGGQMQSFNAVVHPLAQTLPGWKVLTALANALQLDNFEFNCIQDVREKWPDEAALKLLLDNRLTNFIPEIKPSEIVDGQLIRIGEIPLYHVDVITRRAESLQLTNQATVIFALLNPISMRRYALRDGDIVTLRQKDAEIHLAVKADEAVPIGALRVPGAHPLTQGLSGLFDPIEIERD